MNKSKKRLGIALIVTLVLLVPILILAGLWFSEETSATGFYVTNVFSDSASIAVIKNGEMKLPVNTPVLFVNGEKIPSCAKVSDSVTCLSRSENNRYYAYYEVDNLTPDSGYYFGWSDTLKGKIISDKDVMAKVATKEVDENIPQVERIYGLVTDNTDNGKSDVLVIVENLDDPSELPLSAVTTENGSYSITYLEENTENYLQNFTVYGDDGSTDTYRTASFYNKPVSDIMMSGDSDEKPGLFSQLSQEVYAQNSCITDTDMGGIRAQCNDTIDWTHHLDTATCPENEHRFKLGVIKHTDTTKYHNPDGVTLKLYDTESKQFVQDPNTEEDLVVSNGAYVNLDVVELELGRKYQIKAYEGDNECTNTTEKDPYVIYNTPEGKEVDDPVENPSDDSTYIPAPTSNMDLCKKVGENFAIYYEVPVDKMQRAVNLRMRWGEALITSLDGMDAYKKSVINGKNVGMNMILRLCYKGNCQVNDGTAYGNAIVRVYNELKNSGRLPSNGLFIHAGHNEPNASEYVDPAVEAQFMANTLSVLDSAGILSQDPEDIGVKAISSNLDLYTPGDGQWPGCNDCDDPNPHPIYTAPTYVTKLLENSAFSAQAGKLYAWAVNDYLLDRGTNNIVEDVNNFTNHLQSNGQTTTIVLTEMGRINTGLSWDALRAQINELDKMDNVDFMLLFNSLGSNKDAAFTYHSELWNDDNKIRYLLESCGSGNFNVPQEGETDNYVNPGSPGGSPGGSVGVTPGNPAGTSGPGGYGNTNNGNDPCTADGMCVGPGYMENTTADGGLLNGDFENAFGSDGANELNVPQYWHAWYQNGCQGGSCGSYSCSPDGAICRRPEYKQSSDFDNRWELGGSRASSQWFTTFGTMYAGLFQHVYLGEGSATGDSVNSLEFKASGSSWSATNEVDDEGNPIEAINKFIGRVGIDPTGGINPNSGSVVWSDWQYLPNVGPNAGSDFTRHEVSTESSSERITVFIAANNEYPYRNSDTYWDNAELWVNGELAIGNPESSTSDGYGPAGGNCDETSQGGPDGDACWSISGGSCNSGTYVERNGEVCCQGTYITACINASGEAVVYGGPDASHTMTRKDGVEASSYLGHDTDDGVSNVGAVNNELCVFNHDYQGTYPEHEWMCISTGGVQGAATTQASMGGAVLGATTVQLPGRGEYEMQSEQFEFTNNRVINYSRDPKTVPVFQDTDGDGVHDEDEYYVPNVLDLSVEKVGDALEYDLKPGIMMISVPFYTEDFDEAMEIVEEIASQGGVVSSVASYSNAANDTGWKSISKKGSQVYGDDFNLSPGDAMYLVVQKAAKVRLKGQSYSTPVQEYVKHGWNLVAMKGEAAQIKASELIDEINALPGVVATKVTIWDPKRGRFVSYIEDGDSVYGENFNIDETMGVFVFVKEGVGYWTPGE